jgi:hypothetical protein
VVERESPIEMIKQTAIMRTNGLRALLVIALMSKSDILVLIAAIILFATISIFMPASPLELLR